MKLLTDLFPAAVFAGIVVLFGRLRGIVSNIHPIYIQNMLNNIGSNHKQYTCSVFKSDMHWLFQLIGRHRKENYKSQDRPW